MAVVAAYLQALADDKTVPAADADDPRWASLSQTDQGMDDEEWEEEDDESKEPEDVVYRAAPNARSDPAAAG